MKSQIFKQLKKELLKQLQLKQSNVVVSLVLVRVSQRPQVKLQEK